MANTPHYHKTYDEHFEVLEGALEVRLGKDTKTLHSGQKVVAPKNTLHCFHNPADEPVRFLVELRPGSSGFEKSLKAGYRLAADGLTSANGVPKNPYHLALLLEWSEARLPGIFTVVEPLFWLLARLAHRKGIDKELEKTYCR